MTLKSSENEVNVNIKMSFIFRSKKKNNKQTIPFTYLIGWSKLDVWYYGVRYAKGCAPKDLWVKYFTSSKIVKDFVKTNGNPDIIEIRKTFVDAESARLHECKVLRRLKVKTKDKFLNSHDMIGFPVMVGEYNPAKRPEVREKLSINRKLNPLSDVATRKMRKTKTLKNLVNFVKKRKTFIPTRLPAKIQVIEKYITLLIAEKPHLKYIISWLQNTLILCKNAPLKGYPKTRKRTKRRNVPAI